MLHLLLRIHSTYCICGYFQSVMWKEHHTDLCLIKEYMTFIRGKREN